MPYLHRPWRLAAIFAAFFVVQLPMIAWSWPWFQRGDLGVFSTFATRAYMSVFGLTHFYVTFLLYFQGENRRHFLSSPGRIAAYFGLPLAILVLPWAFFGFALDQRYVAFATACALLMRAADFYHLNRQSFGVLQLMKGPANAAVPAWARSAENLYFLALAAVLYVGFLQGGSLQPFTVAAGLVLAYTAATLVAVGVGYAQALRAGAPTRALGIGIAYLVLQTAAVVPSVVWIGFYPFTLAIHYVEYHLLMGPRWLDAPLEDAPLDRALGWMRAAPVVTFAGMAGLGALYYVLLDAGRLDAPPVPRPLLHVLDGLFLCHYVIDMFVWKFSDPFYRRTLGPLYASK